MLAFRCTCVVFAAAISVAVSWAPRADACSPEPQPDPLFLRGVAPPGGLWWLASWERVDQLTLTQRDGGGASIVVDVAARGLQQSFAVRVPADAVPGTVYELPPEARFDPDGAVNELVVSDAPDDAPDGDVPAPDLAVDVREALCGYGPAIALPTPCRRGAGLWLEQWCEQAFARVVVPPGHVLDLLARAPDVEALAPLTSANESIFDAHEPVLVEVLVPPPPDAEFAFDVHARFRRVVDSAEGDVVTVPVERDDARPSRVGCVGCAAADGSACVVALAALAALRRRRA